MDRFVISWVCVHLLKILIFDEGGIVDTVSLINKRFIQKIQEKEPIIKEALELFTKGLESHDIL